MESKDNQPVLFRAGLLEGAPLPLEEGFLAKFGFSCRRHAIGLNLGGIKVNVMVDDDSLAKHIESKYGVFLSEEDPHLRLDVAVEDPIPFKTLMSTFCTYRHENITAAKFRDMAGYVDLHDKTGKAVIGPTNFNQDFENFLRPVICAVTPLFDSILFHTSAIEKDGEAYVFFGPSGAGKSTITKLLSEMAAVMTDDMMILRRDGDRVLANTCGFWGGRTTEYPTLRLSAPVKAFFPLKKSKANRAASLGKTDAVLAFLLNIPSVARTVEEQEGILDLAKIIVQSCPFHELHFCKDDTSFWAVVQEALAQG